MDDVWTGRALGLLACPACRLLVHADATAVSAACPRCLARLAGPGSRAPRSDRTAAFLVAATLLFVPANLLPVMTTATVLSRRSDTIMSGVAALWAQGSGAIATLVFLASIVVPALKLCALTLLVVSRRWWPGWRRPERARLFRWVERVGRWSMLDIMVMALLAALVRSAIARVEIETGALAFAGVVVLTLLASSCFDPRTIWEEPEPRGSRRAREEGRREERHHEDRPAR
jgi:paraquat-inducible protein A